MANKDSDDVTLKRAVQELRKGQLDTLIRLENLEDRLAALEGGVSGEGKPKEPEPILTCVQCAAEYKESENAEGGCKYHSKKLQDYWNQLGMCNMYTYNCCNKTSKDYDSAKTLPGCTKGKHRSKHHTDYVYANYFFYMIEQSRQAKQVWMTMDVEDYITEKTEWAEVGLSAADGVYILVGTSRIEYVALVEFSIEELKCCESPCFTALEKSDSVGWEIKAKIHSSEGIASAISVSIKAASSSTAVVKQVQLVLDGSVPQCGAVECVSGFAPAKPAGSYSIPEDSHTGPALDPGEDYSKDRKNDYESETSDGCPLKLAQEWKTQVSSSNKQSNGKWNNIFTAKVKVTNTTQENVAFTEILGEYMNHDGEWVKCDKVFMGIKGWHGVEWSESTKASMASSIEIVSVQLCIQFSDDPPYEGRRAHFSLPQPLHLRAIFVDQQSRKSSLRFEQGNPPLPLATRKSRERSWGYILVFHLYADDVTADDVTRKNRSDAALYYNNEGQLVYRCAPNDDTSQYFYIMKSLSGVAYNAVKSGKEEFEFTEMRKENKGSRVCVYAVVDLSTGVPYALKVAITTPTSSATGYWLIPQEDSSSASMSVEPQEVRAKGELTVNWSVPRCSKHDTIAIYPHFGKNYVGSAEHNKAAEVTGSAKFQAPVIPGEYEVRYSPSWLQSQKTGHHHDTHWATTVFSVKAA